jgi:hypothetical protein
MKRFALLFILTVLLQAGKLSAQCLDAGAAVAAICPGATTAALGGSFMGEATSAVWSDGGAGGTFTNNGGATPGTTTYTASASASGTVTLTLTAHGGACEGTTVTKTLTIKGSSTANAGSGTIDICKNSPTPSLGGTVGGSATTGIWTCAAGGNFSPSATDLNATWTPPLNYSGNTSVILTTTDGCTVATDSRSVRVHGSLTVSAGTSPSDLCQGQTTAALGGTVDVNATSATWDDGGAGGTFSNNGGSTPTLATYTAALSSPLTVTLTLTAHGSCGDVSDSKTLTVNPIPTVSIGSALPDICQGIQTGNLGGGYGGSATSATWSDGGAGGTFISNSGSTPGTARYTPVNSTTPVTLRLTSSGGLCLAATSTKQLIVKPSPAANSQSTAVCEDGYHTGTKASVDLTALNNSVKGGISGNTVAWYSDNSYTALISSPSSVTVSNAEVFYPLVTNPVSSCSNGTTATYTVNTKPEASGVGISGFTTDGSTLTADYTYSQGACLPEVLSKTEISWYTSTDGTDATQSWIATKVATDKTYLVSTFLAGKFIKVCVRTSDGTLPLTDPFCSGWKGPVIANAAPVASNVQITGTTKPKSLLTASYNYTDNELDPEGASVYQWYTGSSSNGLTPLPISGATNKTYLLTESEVGYYIGFKVTPVATRGTLTGTPATTVTWVGMVVNDPPVVSGLSVSGTVKVGSILTAVYTYSDNEGDLESGSLFQWYTGTLASPVAIIGATSRTFQLTNGEYNKSVGFSVTPKAATGSLTGSMVYVPVWTANVTNPPPVSTVPVITGSRNVGSQLIGQYTYSDAEGDLESGTHYQWFATDDSTVAYHTIPNDTAVSHTILLSEQGMYFKFSVTPKTTTGSTTGLTRTTPYSFGPVNSKPSATATGVAGSPVQVGTLLTAQYSFSDPDHDLEGTSPIRWFRDGNVIPGENGKNYLLNSNDAGFTISFEVTPVSLTGYPNTGDPKTYTMPTPVADPSGPKPVASSVCIDGRRAAGSVLTGKYTYTYPLKSEGNSAYQWYLENTPIPGATTVTYTLKSSDLTHSIYFEVTPKSSNNIPVTGSPVRSQQLAAFSMAKYAYSVSDPDVLLKALPSGGYFYGTGVLNGNFSPKSVDYTKGPFAVTYHYDTLSCGQDAVASFSVSPNTASFQNIKPFYCQNGGYDTIRVVGFKNPIINAKFTYSYTGADLQIYHDSLVIINLSTLRPSNNQDFLKFTAEDSYTGSLIEIPQFLVVDSIKNEKFIIRDSVFCNSDDKVSIETVQKDGVFSFPVVNKLLDPSLVSRDTMMTVSYTYTSTHGCVAKASKLIAIHPSPKVDFNVADSCIKTGNATIFRNDTKPDSVVTRYIWAFNDNGVVKPDTINVITGHENINSSYQYQKGGFHKITLYALSKNNCNAFKEKTIEFATRPNADFAWWNFCRHDDDSLHFSDTLTTSDTKIVSTAWEFIRSWQTSDTVRKNNQSMVNLSQDSTGIIYVKYIARTAYKGCTDTASKILYIRPTVEIGDKDYFEDFEKGKGNWTVNETDTMKWWAFGKPSRTKINTAASGDSAWYISRNPESGIVRNSSVVSPCFDFTDAVRPMIDMKIITVFNRNRDGAALQYKIGDSNIWTYIGSLGDGINWYNSTQIQGRPGGDQVGWTYGTKLDSVWNNAEHRLDDLIGKKDVKFRIVYGTNGITSDNEGLAFDDVKISGRTRRVLLENFTNTSSTDARTASDAVANLSSRWPSDIVSIQYHTNFPGSDAFFDANPGDASARILSYGLSRTPYTFIDGGTGIDNAMLYDYIQNTLDSNDLNNRSMIDPGFMITLHPAVSNGILTVNGGVKATKAYTGLSNLTLYIAVTENKSKGDPSNKEYYNVFRKFIPDAGGLAMKRTWAINDRDTITDKSWVIANIKSGADIKVIAFLQNNITKEVYQAESVDTVAVAVGIEDLFSGKGNDFALYPNPAASKVTVAFDDPLKEITDLRIYDYSGSLIKTYRIGAGGTEYTFDDLGLNPGIYLIRVSVGGVDHGFKKLVVSDK